MIKFAMIGMQIPSLFPAMLTDLLYAEKMPAVVAVQEGNPAMQDVLHQYAMAVVRRSGIQAEILISGEIETVLKDADCVIYADDCMPGSRFQMDRQALGSDVEDDPGLSAQARVNGGLGGLMHTLRAGNLVLDLCDDMEAACPEALVINLGQPVARTTEIFLRRGFRCYGLGKSPMKGPNGLEALCRKMSRKPDSVIAEMAGLPGFSFLISLKDRATGEDLMDQLKWRAQHGELGRLTERWLDWWGALPVGEVTDHAEFLPEQEDYLPEEQPSFGETVEQRKQRILEMNTVGREGASSQAGALAQASLLSRAEAVRPIQLAMALLKHKDLDMPAVIRRNHQELIGLSGNDLIEARLTLNNGQEMPHGTELPGALREIMGEIAETNTLAAQAAFGDRSALRECVEIDPALAGLDRLYCQDVVDSLIRLHEDVLPRF